MVLNCVAYGCSHVQKTNDLMPFHTFPFKRPEILELWVKAIRRDNWYPSKTSRICGRHFLETDYLYRPWARYKLLKPEAVPSVFSFVTDQLFRKTPNSKVLLRQDIDLSNENMDIKDIEVTDYVLSTSAQTTSYTVIKTESCYADDIVV